MSMGKRADHTSSFLNTVYMMEDFVNDWSFKDTPRSLMLFECLLLVYYDFYNVTLNISTKPY